MAVQVFPGLFVGPAADIYKFSGSILHCARDPWFAQAMSLPPSESLFRDTTGKRVCLWVRMNPNEMALNMVDAADGKYFCDDLIDAGLNFITERFAETESVLVHCNMGISRSPSMAFLWMFEHGYLDDEFRYAVPQFREKYKDWCPGNGIWAYLKARCERGHKVL